MTITILWRYHAAMIFASLTFSVMNIAVGQLKIPTLVFCLYRDSLACPLLAIFAAQQRAFRRILSTTHAILFLGVGLTNILGQQLLFVLGDRWSTPDLAAFYQPVTPCLTVALALTFRLESLSFNRLFGILVAGVGIVVISRAKATSRNDAASGWELVAANAVMFGNNVCASLGVLLQKPLNSSYSPVLIITLSYVAAVLGLCVIVGAGLASGFLRMSAFDFPLHDIAIVLYTAVVCSALNYYLITWANASLDASIITCYVVLQPVFTTVLAFIFLKEMPYLGEILGGVLCIVGLFLTVVSFPSCRPSTAQCTPIRVNQEPLESTCS